MRLALIPLVAFGAPASLALAQSATLAVTHNDPDGLVTPGQTVQITATLASISTINLWEIRGSLLTSPNLGVATNNTFPHPYPIIGPLTIVNPGTPSGGSVLNAHIRTGDQAWLIGWGAQSPWTFNPLTVLEFNWTAPATPGAVTFAWQSDAALPSAWFVAPALSLFAPVPVPTTYLGTSLTVVPAPASGLLLASGMLAAAWRRRNT